MGNRRLTSSCRCTTRARFRGRRRGRAPVRAYTSSSISSSSSATANGARMPSCRAVAAAVVDHGVAGDAAPVLPRAEGRRFRSLSVHGMLAATTAAAFCGGGGSGAA